MSSDFHYMLANPLEEPVSIADLESCLPEEIDAITKGVCFNSGETSQDGHSTDINTITTQLGKKLTSENVTTWKYYK